MKVPRLTMRRAALGGVLPLAVTVFTASAAPQTPPGPTFSLSAQPNAAGWVTAPLTVTTSCIGGFTPDPPVFGPFGEQAPGVVITAGCLDNTGGVKTDGTFALPGIDLTAPSISPSDIGVPGATGWFTVAPTVRYACGDALSGVASCPGAEQLPDGAGPWVRTVVDRAGLSSSVALDAKVDTRPPPAPAVRVPANGGRYEIGGNYTVDFACPADATSGVAQCSGAYGSGGGAGAGGALDVGEPGNPGTMGDRSLTVSSVDHAGLRSSTTVSYRVVDTIAPTTPALAIPAPDAVTSQRTPMFSWAASADGGSGMREYRINVGGKAYVLPASGAMQTGFRIPDALVDGTYEWQVFAFDNAGNVSSSPKRRFRVDPNAVGAPVLTGGPASGSATSSSTPVFSFTGAPGATFSWRTLDSRDQEVPGGSGSGASSVTLPQLADGTYTFAVAQTTIQGQLSEPAVVLFRVDTVAPGAPRVTAAPSATIDPLPSFAWAAAEAGGSFSWEILDAARTRVVAGGATAESSVRVATPVPGGDYVFHVRQTDGAGNPGPWSAEAAFTILTLQSPPAPSNVNTNRTVLGKPATRRAGFLRPVAGARVNARRVVLSWRRVPGASLYNVQVFRLNGTRYTKAFSAFPRGSRVVIPKAKLKAGQRYAWRVWPLMARTRKYTAKPFGVSWFDTRRAAAG